jgi:thiosulfate/3-mercaptopyruvate sulfurtransferase
MLSLPEPEAFQEALRSIGVNESSRIVVYWSDERVTAASRALFTLDWAGLGDRASLLDGGFGAWKAAGFEVEESVPVAEPGNVTIQPRDEMIVDAEWVQTELPADGYQLVDARAAAFFDGVREDRGVPGHIASAGSIPWTSLLDEETMKLHPEEKLRELLNDAGVSPGDTVVGYCHIGLFTTLALLSARLLGHEVLLYDGSFEDWAGRELPTISGP